MTRILLVDDHPIVRRGIREVLAGAFDPAVVGEAASAEEGLTEARITDWDVMVLDLSLPGTSGLDLLRDLRREHPSVPVIILSVHPADQFARRAMNAGAAGYLTKDSPPTEIVRAVTRVMAGEKYLNQVPIDDPDETPQPESREAGHEALSDREYQVLRLLASGLTVAQVAQRLSLSPKTIGTYRARILEKMGLRTTADLIQYALRHKLVG